MRTLAQKPKAAQQTASAKYTIPGPVHSGQNRALISILHLQHTMGNQAVQRLPQNNAEELSTGWIGKRPPCFGHAFSRIPINSPSAGVLQSKLAVNTSGDACEKEADRVAAQVMRMPESSAQPIRMEPQTENPIATGGMHRAFVAVPSSDSVRRQATNDDALIDAPQVVNDVVSESGRPLGPAVRSFMEPRFGQDFSRVRIHTGRLAAESARAVNAVAYTVGEHVVFDEAAYSPGTDSGRRLIAHELAHVIQQKGADTGVRPDSENENGDSGALGADLRLHSFTSSDRRVQRQEACYCCVSSVAIKNISRIDNATHMGHSYDLEIQMARSTQYGPRLAPECTLEWWEKTNVPYTAGMAANTWTNMFRLLPTSPTFNPWHNRSTACDANSTVTINDPPALGKRPGRTVTRTLEFDLKVKSGPGGSCANSEQSATATQVLTMVNGAPDWANSSFT